MAGERRTLVEGLAPASSLERSREAEFLHAGKSAGGHKAMQAASSVASGVPLSTRIHPDYATALRRASLERRLNGITPNTLREILEDVLGPWLRANGYLP